ncbi:MAG TPA: class I SAM-dependent methyltransferase [Hyphomicrobiaceae bacterium]|nr:class I SAM-dependent methyltransferase [Hyphomicrobiaceae bacterium]
MQLKYIPRDVSRWLRRATGTYGKASGRLDRSRPDNPLPLRPEHIAATKVFATRFDYMASLPTGGTAAEVGVQTGRFSAFLLETVKPQSLHLIDLTFEKLNNTMVREHPAVTLHEGNSAQVLSTFPDEFFDWIYIDAGHLYDDVRADATVAKRKIKPNGLLIFNDYIIWAHHEGFAYGVVPVVNEMCVNEGFEMVALAMHNNMHLDVALKRRDSGTP